MDSDAWPELRIMPVSSWCDSFLTVGSSFLTYCQGLVEQQFLLKTFITPPERSTPKWQAGVIRCKTSSQKQMPLPQWKERNEREWTKMKTGDLMYSLSNCSNKNMYQAVSFHGRKSWIPRKEDFMPICGRSWFCSISMQGMKPAQNSPRKKPHTAKSFAFVQSSKKPFRSPKIWAVKRSC